MMGFGLAHMKYEGAPAHPEDVYEHCGCDKCEARFKKQAKAYFDYRRSLGAPEAQLAQESWYEPPEVS
jgi:hypothetical protein